MYQIHRRRDGQRERSVEQLKWKKQQKQKSTQTIPMYIIVACPSSSILFDYMKSSLTRMYILYAYTYLEHSHTRKHTHKHTHTHTRAHTHTHTRARTHTHTHKHTHTHHHSPMKSDPEGWTASVPYSGCTPQSCGVPDVQPTGYSPLWVHSHKDIRT